MKHKSFLPILSISFLLLLFHKGEAQMPFVTVKNHRFYIGNEPQYFVGTNYWYGGLLGLMPDNKKGITRLQQELDFLQSKGIINLRVLAGPEGEGPVSGVERVKPSLQINKGEFDGNFLNGLDILLSEMSKRNMKAVIFLSNNWEWSGGFLQYLNWNKLIEDSVFRRKLSWDEYRDYVSRFYSCDSCQSNYLKQVNYILNRINHITKQKYRNDPAIMSWEIANEPRPMRAHAIQAYKRWIAGVAAFMKSVDENHLITIGTEGEIGTENMETYEAIHSDSNIDYLTIHIWPKNWDWFHDDLAAGMDSVLYKTQSYLTKHEIIARKLKKPLVIEEFGLPRDNHSFTPGSSTFQRDKYFSFILNAFQTSRTHQDVLGGVNFWSYGGEITPSHEYWQEGDDYIGDPPMEEQGLNAVFNSDKSTWEVIRSFVEKK